MTARDGCKQVYSWKNESVEAKVFSYLYPYGEGTTTWSKDGAGDGTAGQIRRRLNHVDGSWRES